MKRRDFLKTSAAGLAYISLSSFGCSGGGGYLGGHTFELTITEALHEMVDGKKVYVLAYEDTFEHKPRVPGPVLKVTAGDQVKVKVKNSLSSPHGFAISGVVSTGPIPPHGEKTVTFVAPAGGAYFYFDPVNVPVNRILGLHGALLSVPAHGNTPYSNPTPMVQKLFDDLGTTAHFPKHALSPPGWQKERTKIWVLNQVDPSFNEMALEFEESGGKKEKMISPERIKSEFLPRYFTMNGFSGAFASHAKKVKLEGRIGQPMVVHVMNVGLFAHSNHLHANHYYVISINGKVQNNLQFLDTMTTDSEDRIDWLVPFIRPPDIAGDETIPLRDLIPNELDLVLITPQSPLKYPMHCHVEMSQTAAGGNYPQGMVTDFEFLGDIDGVDFPFAEEAEASDVE